MRSWLWLLLSVAASVVSWSYMHRVLLPWEQLVNVQYAHLQSQMGDLYSRWVGTRALLVEGKNPYGPEVTHEIQMAFYGHDIHQDRTPGAPTIDEQRFAYPVYVVFLLAPTAHMTFDTVQAVAPAVLAVVVAGDVLLWLAVLHWRVSPIKAVTVVLFMLSSPQIVQGLRLRQLGLIVACLIALGTWLILRDNLIGAGVVLALSTIKPQMAILPLAWFFIWTTGDLVKRWRLLAGFCGAMALLTGAAELLLPGWLQDFLQGLYAYHRYGPVRTSLQMLLADRLGLVLGIGLIAIVLVHGWINRKNSATTPQFTETLCLFLISAALALPLMAQFNQSLLIPVALMIVRDWATLPKAARIVFVVFTSWPGVTALVLLIAAPTQLKASNPLPLLPSGLVLAVPYVLPLLLRARRTSDPLIHDHLMPG